MPFVGRPDRFDQPRENPFRPTLFIGLGGTGKEVLLRVRRKFWEKASDVHYWPTLGYLWIDSAIHENYIAAHPSYDHIAKEIAFLPEERINIGMKVEQVRHYYNNRDRFEHIWRWFPGEELETFLTTKDIVDGAKQMRPVGRLQFFHHFDAIRERINSRIQDVMSHAAAKKARQNGFHLSDEERDKVDVVVVTSLAGGTGSGTFLDTAFLLRYLQTGTIHEIVGYLLLPEVFTDCRELEGTVKEPERNSMRANGYGALMELEYYSARQDVNSRYPGLEMDVEWRPGLPGSPIEGPPFDTCYLIGSSNGTPLGTSREIFEMVSESIHLEFSSSNLAREKRSSRVNADSYKKLVFTDEVYARDASGRKKLIYAKGHSTRFSSFGLAQITTQREELRHMAAYQLAKLLVEDEVGAWPNDEERQEMVARVLQELSLSGTPRGRFTARLRQNVKAGLGQHGSKLAETYSELEDKSEQVYSEIRSRHGKSYDKIAGTLNDEVEALLGRASGLLAEIRSSSGLRNAIALREALAAELRSRASELASEADSLANELAGAAGNGTPAPSGPLDRLVDAEGIWIPFFRNRAVAILRAEAASGVEQGVSRRADIIDLEVSSELCRELARRIESSTGGERDVESWLRELCETALSQPLENLRQSFRSERNVVLTAGLATEENLTREIEALLAGKSAGGMSPRLRRLRQQFTRSFGEEFGVACSSLTELHETEKQVTTQDLIERLIPFCHRQVSRVMHDRPALRILFQTRQGTFRDDLKAVASASRPYFRTSGEVENLKENMTQQRFGFEEESSRDLGSFQSRIKDFAERELGVSPSPHDGDAVIHYQEITGIPICSFSGVSEYQRAYMESIADAGGSKRHSSKYFGHLPEVRTMDPGEAQRLSEAIQEVLLGAIIGSIPFSRETGQFYILEEELGNTRHQNLGPNLDTAVSRICHRDGLAATDLLDLLVRRRVEWVRRSVEAPAQGLEAFRFLHSLLRFSRRHIFPPRTVTLPGNQGTTFVDTPKSTLLKTLQRDFVAPYVERLAAEAGTSEELSALLEDAYDRLHEVVDLVGPEDQPILCLDFEPSEERSARVLEWATRLFHGDSGEWRFRGVQSLRSADEERLRNEVRGAAAPIPPVPPGRSDAGNGWSKRRLREDEHAPAARRAAGAPPDRRTVTVLEGETRPDPLVEKTDRAPAAGTREREQTGNGGDAEEELRAEDILGLDS